MFVTPIGQKRTIEFDKKDPKTREKTGEKGTFTVQKFIFHDEIALPTDPMELMALDTHETSVADDSAWQHGKTYALGSETFYERGGRLAMGNLVLVEVE